MATNADMLDVETVERLVISSRPRRGLLRGSRLALLGLGVMLGAYLADPEIFGKTRVSVWVVPQVILVVLAGSILWTVLRQRRLARLTLTGFEALQLRQWDRARPALVQLLRGPVTPRQTRAEVLLALASLAEEEHQYDAAQRVLELILEEEHADPIQLHTARVVLAAVMLRTGQTADAVDLIDRLSRVELPGPLRAQIELLKLFREVAMGQGAEGLDRADERRDLFRRHLGTRAGFGYALLAAACDHAREPERAGRFWHDATLLIRPEELVHRFEELSPMAGKYRAAEIAL